MTRIKTEVAVDGQAFVLEKNLGQREWGIYWRDEPPNECHPQLGALSWPLGASDTGDLIVTNVDQRDSAANRALLVRVAEAAGLGVRPRKVDRA